MWFDLIHFIISSLHNNFLDQVINIPFLNPNKHGSFFTFLHISLPDLYDPGSK